MKKVFIFHVLFEDDSLLYLEYLSNSSLTVESAFHRVIGYCCNLSTFGNYPLEVSSVRLLNIVSVCDYLRSAGDDEELFNYYKNKLNRRYGIIDEHFVFPLYDEV